MLNRRSRVAVVLVLVLGAALCSCGAGSAEPDLPVVTAGPTTTGPSGSTAAVVAPTTTVASSPPSTTTASPDTVGSTAPVVAPSEEPTFPLRVADGDDHLVDAAGVPFQLRGDAAWSLIAQLHDEDVLAYLDNRHRLGFNTILVNLIEHKFSSDPPNNVYGEAPFTTPGDFSTPNDAYFDRARWVVQQAADRGIVVLLVAAYLGYDGGDEGFYGELQKNSPAQLETYGRYVGERFSGLDNVIWVGGGDYTPPDRGIVETIMTAIRAADPGALQTVHTSPGEIASAAYPDAAWLDVDNVYPADDDVWSKSSAFFAHADRPYFVIEAQYENEHGRSDQQVRAEGYAAYLSGAMGYVFGNNPIWHFDAPGLFDAPVDWREAMNGSGSLAMSALFAQLSAVPWWTMSPDVDHVLAGRDAFAAIAADRATALVYAAGDSIDLDLTQLAAGAVTVTWVDPADGSVAGAVEDARGQGERVRLVAPASPTDASDWLLVVSVA